MMLKYQLQGQPRLKPETIATQDCGAELLFSTGLVAVLRSLEPRETDHVPSFVVGHQLTMGAKELQEL